MDKYVVAKKRKATQPILLPLKIRTHDIPPGLIYVENFVDEHEERTLITEIDHMKWSNELKRRVQHYGYKYDYKDKAIGPKIGELPSFCDLVIKRMDEESLLFNQPDQLIINEYLPGQGIAPHVDRVQWFDDNIFCLSLGSNYTMVFKHLDSTLTATVLLERRSVVLMTKQSRYRWLHSIQPKKTDEFNGEKWNRERRLSMTFRKVKK